MRYRPQAFPSCSPNVRVDRLSTRKSGLIPYGPTNAKMITYTFKGELSVCLMGAYNTGDTKNFYANWNSE